MMIGGRCCHARNSQEKTPRGQKIARGVFLWGCFKAQGRDAPKNSLISAAGQVSDHLPCAPKIRGISRGVRVVEDLIWREM